MFAALQRAVAHPDFDNEGDVGKMLADPHGGSVDMCRVEQCDRALVVQACRHRLAGEAQGARP